VLATEFELKAGDGAFEKAEQRYLDYHVDVARRLPNLRHYMISKYQMSRIPTASASRLMRNPLRMAMLVFDSFEASLDAYDSPIGRELMEEHKASIAKDRIYRIDAAVQR
jgi:hypothetical protein